MRETLAGTFTLVRLGLRRDRWLLPLWIAAFVLMAYSTAAASAGLFPSEVGRIEAATTLNSTASMVALFGRIYDPSSLGALAMIKYSAFMTAALAVLMVVITVRHTRQDEATGRIELLSSGRLGRNAPLAAALVISFGASVVLGLLTAAALIAGGLPAAGSLAFGLGWAATGIAFSSVAAVTAQISASSRSAIGLGVIVVAVAYALRAVGDLAEPGPSVFSWLSPIGWNQQVRAFAGDRWAVLLLPLALGILLIPVAIVLRAHRDLGTGLRQDRPGPARGRLSGVWGLAVRLQDRVFLAWAFAVVVFGLLIGSLADGVTDFLTSPNAQEFIQKLGGASALTDAFLAAQIAIMGILVSVYGVSAANHLK
jgi:ABC-2 type transport system permease protein